MWDNQQNMNETYLNRRLHFRTACDLPILLQKSGNFLKFKGFLTDINETGMAFWFDTSRKLETNSILKMTMPALGVRRPLRFRVRWIKTGDLDGRLVRKVGAEVLSSSAKSFALLVEKIRHIQCWREIEQHLQKRPITMAEAICQWHRLKSQCRG